MVNNIKNKLEGLQEFLRERDHTWEMVGLSGESVMKLRHLKTRGMDFVKPTAKSKRDACKAFVDSIKSSNSGDRASVERAKQAFADSLLESVVARFERHTDLSNVAVRAGDNSPGVNTGALKNNVRSARARLR